jgi:hypothetical protein
MPLSFSFFGTRVFPLSSHNDASFRRLIGAMEGESTPSLAQLFPSIDYFFLMEQPTAAPWYLQSLSKTFGENTERIVIVAGNRSQYHASDAGRIGVERIVLWEPYRGKPEKGEANWASYGGFRYFLPKLQPRQHPRHNWPSRAKIPEPMKMGSYLR